MRLEKAAFWKANAREVDDEATKQLRLAKDVERKKAEKLSR